MVKYTKLLTLALVAFAATSASSLGMQNKKETAGERFNRLHGITQESQTTQGSQNSVKHSSVSMVSASHTNPMGGTDLTSLLKKAQTTAQVKTTVPVPAQTTVPVPAQTTVPVPAKTTADVFANWKQ